MMPSSFTPTPTPTPFILTGALDTSFNTGNGPSYSVNCVAIQDDGKIIIGGNFTNVDGTTRNRIARLNSDGSLDTSFDPGTGLDNAVYSLAVQDDGKIVIGGWFSFYNGAAVSRLARLNSNGSLDTSFNMGTGIDGTVVNSLTLQGDGKILAVGLFSEYNGTATGSIVRLNSDGSLDTGFDVGAEVSSTFRCVTMQNDGKILVAGTIGSLSSPLKKYFARLNADGSLDTAFNTGSSTNGTVACIALRDDNQIYIGGSFTSYDGTSRNYIARVNADGELDTGFDPGLGADDFIKAILVQSDNKIIIAGKLTTYDSNAANSLARVDMDGSFDATFDTTTGANNDVECMALQSDGRLIIGGDFTTYNGNSVPYIARIE